MPTAGSLFTGIGGIDLGLERAGWTLSWQVEIDPWCQRQLWRLWPDVPKFGDVKRLMGDELGPVDLVFGGFPCQPVSNAAANRRRGQADERWLWPDMARIVRRLAPRWVLVENVAGALSFADAGPVKEILRDLAGCGYDAEWCLLPAAAFGAPHLRYRFFLVAYPQRAGLEVGPLFADGPETELAARGGRGSSAEAHLADAEGPPVGAGLCEGVAAEEWQRRLGDSGRERARFWAAEPTLGQLADGLPADVAGRIPGGDAGLSRSVPPVAYGLPGRREKISALGNAVVPQVAQWIGERILILHRRLYE